jgi:hypothetical protein
MIAATTINPMTTAPEMTRVRRFSFTCRVYMREALRSGEVAAGPSKEIAFGTNKL